MLQVLDVHCERDAIDKSVHKWSHNHLTNINTKILLIDTDLLRALLYSDSLSDQRRTIVEQTIVYIHECVALVDTRNSLFVIRYVFVLHICV